MQEMRKQYLLLSFAGKDSEPYAPWAAAAMYPEGINAEPRDEAQALLSKPNLLATRLHSCFYILDCFHEYYQPSVSVWARSCSLSPAILL